MNGNVVPWENGLVHIWSETAIRATNVFEGLRAYWLSDRNCWRIVDWTEHLRRLARSAKLIRIPHSYTESYFALAVRQLLAALPYRENLYVRPTIYVEYGPFTARPEDVDPGAYVVAFPLSPANSSPRILRCLVSSWRRAGDLTSIPRAKSGAIYNNIRLAKIEASERGFDEAVMLNNAGTVAELTGACIFIVRNGVIATPPVTAGILEGITRSWVLRQAQHLNISVQERTIDRTELYIADEVFSAGTLTEICPVGQIDDLTIGSGGVGEITRVMMAAHKARTSGEGDDPADLVVQL